MLIACQFEDKWYRGEVKGFKSLAKEEEDVTTILIDIYIVDYGDSSYLRLDEIKMLAHEFYEFPMQALECHLHDIVLNDKFDDWSDEAIYYFEELTYSCKWQTISLKLVEWGDNQKPYVELFDRTKVNNIFYLKIEPKI